MNSWLTPLTRQAANEVLRKPIARRNEIFMVITERGLLIFVKEQPRMRYKIFGRRTGLGVSELALGAGNFRTGNIHH
jgi:hypothetical protein